MAVDHRALVDAAPDVIAVLDHDGCYLYINDAIETVVGFGPSAVIGKTVDQLMAPDDAARWRDAITEVLATRSPREVTCTLDTSRGPRQLAALLGPLGEHVSVVSREPDLKLLSELSRRTAIALENARLLAAEQTARRAAEDARDRTRRLQALTTALSRALDRQSVLEVFVDAGRDALGATAGFVWMLRDAHTLDLAAAAHDSRASTIAGYTTLKMDAPLPICVAVKTAQVQLFESYQALLQQYPTAPNPTSSNAWAIVPVMADGRAVGAASFSFAIERAFTDDDRELLQAIAGQVSLAVERCRLLEANQRSDEQLRQALHAARATTWTIDLRASSEPDLASVHEDDRPIVRAAFERAIRDNVPYEPVMRIIRDDAELWVHAYGRVTYDEVGTPVGMSGVLVNIDEARRAELRADEERRINDTMHRITASFATELDHDRLVQRILDEGTQLVGAETGSFFAGNLPLDSHQNDASRLEVAIVNRAGDRYGHLQFRHREADRFTDEHQRLVARIATQAAIALENARLYRSVREHKEQLERAIDRARVADRRKDEFLAMLGHELRNPLAPITTALELMNLKEIEGGRKERDIIRRQVIHLSRLIDDLLDVSRITRGKIQLAKRSVELASILSKAIETASPLLEKRAQRLEVAMPPDNILVDADPTRLAQVFQNLLTNAAKYSDQRTRVVLTTTASEDEVTISVRDHGVGIHADLLPRLFDMFVQGERALDRAEGGLGIGLTIARSLTEQHGGTISATSEGAGRGSTFTVKLPRSARTRVTTDAMPPLRAPRQLPASTRVLVVDDNIDAAHMLREMLSELGHELEIAHDGPSALELAESFKPTIAVLDIGLPVMNGYELARKLRETLGPDKLRLIALTGYGQDSDRARAHEVGFDHHLIKPVELDALLALLAK